MSYVRHRLVEGGGVGEVLGMLIRKVEINP